MIARIMHPSRTVGVAAVAGLLALALAAVVIAPRVLGSTGGDSTAAAPRLTVTEAVVTPDPVAPPDVATIALRLQNHGPRVDDAVATLRVVGPDGDVVQDLRQERIGVPENGGQAVYWVWRLPEDLAPGEYRLLAAAAPQGEAPPEPAEAGRFTVQ